MSPTSRVPPAWLPGSSRVAWSVWPTGECGRVEQLRHRGYVPETADDWRGISPAIAAYAISRYSRPGALVVDPECGAGTVLVEALHAGRHAVGVTASSRWWRVARANVSVAKRAGAWSDGTVVDPGVDSAGMVRQAGLTRRTDLILTTVRLPSLLGSSRLEPDLVGMARAWTSMLRPGGYAVVVLRPHRLQDGTFVDVAAALSAAAEGNGLVVTDRCVALTAKLRRDRVVPRASIVERETADRMRAAGIPIALVAHRTVLVMRALDLSEMAAAQGVACPEARPSWDECAYG